MMSPEEVDSAFDDASKISSEINSLREECLDESGIFYEDDKDFRQRFLAGLLGAQTSLTEYLCYLRKKERDEIT